MLAYLVLLLAALSRFLPHLFHSTGLNITAVGGGLLFFGSRRSRSQAVAGAAIMALTDVALTRWVYDYPFHARDYMVTWLWYAVTCLLGTVILRRVSLLRVAGAVLSSATGFFVLSNFEVWFAGTMYPHAAAGLLDCYTAALPFYGNDLVSTGLTCGVLFGLPVAATLLVEAIRHQPNDSSLA